MNKETEEKKTEKSNDPQIHKCKNCGTVVRTKCVEYFCPLCNKPIIQPGGTR